MRKQTVASVSGMLGIVSLVLFVPLTLGITFAYVPETLFLLLFSCLCFVVYGFSMERRIRRVARARNLLLSKRRDPGIRTHRVLDKKVFDYAEIGQQNTDGVDNS